MIYAPPLTHVTGAVELAEVYGGFGPASALTWVGACVGRCGSRPGCREECPAPECSGCGRARHGITHDGGAIGRITPVPARVLPGELDTPHRVLVTGSRSWDDATTLRAALDERTARYGARLVVVHGHCPDGADAHADAWAVAHGVRVERWPADWRTLGKSAGFRRNQAMVDSRPAECLAFIRDGSRGATHCATAAERAGIPTTRYLYGQPVKQPGRPVSAPALPSSYLYGQPVKQPVAEPVKQPVAVLRPAVDISPTDPSLPAAVAGLLQLAAAHGHHARVTASVAARGAGVVAALAVRVPGVGCTVYERTGDSWTFANAVLLAPWLRRANVGQFRAALSGAEYVPPAPRAAAPKGPCPGCGAEVSLTKDGAVFKNHKCRMSGTFRQMVEGRS